MHIITEVNIVIFRARNGLVAMASCVYNNALFLSSIGIMNRLQGGYRISYPTKKLSGERSINMYRPINKEVAKAIEDAILEKYHELTKNDDHIEASFHDEEGLDD